MSEKHPSARIQAALHFLFFPDSTPDYEELGMDTSGVQYGDSYPTNGAAKHRCLEILLDALTTTTEKP